MAEDIDKLIERLRYIRADILARAEREYGRVPTEYQEDAACVDAASTAIKSLRSRVSELEAERDAAALAEREACAQIADNYARNGRLYKELACETADEVAARIRARGNTDTEPQAQVRDEDVHPDGRRRGHSKLVYDKATRSIQTVRDAPSPTPPAAEAVGGALAETTAETGATVAPDSVDPTGLKDHLRALRNANEGFALVVWRASADGETGWDILSPKAAKEAESTLGWLMSIPGDVLMQSIPSIGTNGWLHAGEELQRERGAVAGRDGSSISCALKGTGPAASTASDDLVKEIGQSMDVQYAIGSIINNEGSFFTGRGERMDRLVRAVLSSPPVLSLRSSLFDLVEAVEASVDPKETCAALWSRVDDSRSILSRFQSEGAGETVNSNSQAIASGDEGGEVMAFGQCDCCGRSNVSLGRTEAYGIETYACAHCFGYPADEFDEDPPRRCDTNVCDPGGECMACGAANGEVCRNPNASASADRPSSAVNSNPSDDKREG